MSEERTPFTVHCSDCKHEWVAFYFPLTLDKNGLGLLKAASKHCPMCTKKNVMVGSAPKPEGEAA